MSDPWDGAFADALSMKPIPEGSFRGAKRRVKKQTTAQG
jgi:hypothetical protein